MENTKKYFCLNNQLLFYFRFHFQIFLYSLAHFYLHRTKWKRQNQLRLEQLRHQASVEKELMSAGTAMRVSNEAAAAAAAAACCPTRYATQSPCSFLTTAAAAIFHNVTYVHGCQL